MSALLKEIRGNPLLWLLAFVPVVIVAAKLRPEADTILLCYRCSPSCRSPLC